jgi:hypothetical protein
VGPEAPGAPGKLSTVSARREGQRDSKLTDDMLSLGDEEQG